MPTPKSVTKTKVNKNGCTVTYESGLDQTQYYLHELSRAALRDVGKFMTKAFRNKFYSHFKKRSGDAGKVTKYKVISSAKTTAPRVQIGLMTGKVDGFYAYFQEFGAADGRIPKLGLLTNVCKDNVAEIVKIESQYLSGLEKTAAELEAMVKEEDMEGDADEN